MPFCQGVEAYVGDGYCDDYNNSADCNYDGGDCCYGSHGLCEDCLCIGLENLR